MKYTLKQIEIACLETCERFEGYYLDWMNNFVSVQGYADFYDLPLDYARQRIRIGRKIHEKNTAKKA